jgi:hypothetical protein
MNDDPSCSTDECKPEEKIVGSQCATTGPDNCQACCEEKQSKGTMNDDPSCSTDECKPDQMLVGSQCVTTGPDNCRSCCEEKLTLGTMTNDASCLTEECRPESANLSSGADTSFKSVAVLFAATLAFRAVF